MSTNRLLSKNERSSTHVHMDEQNAVCVLANKLKNMVDRYKQRDLIVLCIGTDRSTGDALGPLVGSMLQKEYMRHFHIYGTLEKPIHAVNLKDEIIKIKKTHPFSYIIAIDACLGRLANVGNITIADGPVKPGAAVSKKLPPVGDLHITGIVNISGMMEFFVLQNTRLFTTMKLADTIYNAIKKADSLLLKRSHRAFIPTYMKKEL